MKRAIVVGNLAIAVVVFVTLCALSQYCGTTSPRISDAASGHVYAFDYKGVAIYVSWTQHLILEYSLWVVLLFFCIGAILNLRWKVLSTSSQPAFRKLH
jgi:hypothetical protein